MKLSGAVENYKILQSKYDGSWRKMWLLRPRLRFDGSTSISYFITLFPAPHIDW